MFSDPAELMDGGRAGNDRVIIHLNVASEGHRIRQDDMIANLAVMGDMPIAKEQIMRADAGGGIRMGATVDRGVFPENIVVANFKISGIAHILEVLCFATNGGKGEKLIPASEFRVAFNDDMRVQDTIIAELDICTNDTKRANADIASQRGEW